MGVGHDCYLQIGREATWKTAVASTRRFNVLSGDIHGERGKVRSDVIVATRNRKDIYAGPQIGRASVSLEADYEGQLHLWDALLGTATFGANGMTVTGAGPYTWTGKQRELFSSYSMQLVTNVPSGKCDLLVGAKLNSMKLSGAVGFDAKPVRMDLEFVGASVATNSVTTAGPSANSAKPAMTHHIDTAAFDSGTGDAAGSERLRSFEFSINNHLSEYFYGADTIEEPVADDFATTSIKWVTEFSTRTALDEYLAHTSGAPIIKFAHPTLTKSIQISMPVGYIVTPVGRPVDRYGVLTQEFTYEAVDDGASPSSGVTVTIINAEATLT